MNQTMTTKDRIIKTTLDIISDEGFQNVTVRKIAARAQVNIAAVNYHFGSKDLVIDKALRYVTSQLKRVFTVLKNMEQPAPARLRSFVQAYADTVYQYPDIIRYMVDQKIHHGNSHVEYSEFLEQEGIQLLLETLKELYPGDGQEMISYLYTIQILSSISFSLLMGASLAKACGYDLMQPSTRTKFVELMVDRVLDV